VSLLLLDYNDYDGTVTKQIKDSVEEIWSSRVLTGRVLDDRVKVYSRIPVYYQTKWAPNTLFSMIPTLIKIELEKQVLSGKLLWWVDREKFLASYDDMANRLGYNLFWLEVETTIKLNQIVSVDKETLKANVDHRMVVLNSLIDVEGGRHECVSLVLTLISIIKIIKWSPPARLESPLRGLTVSLIDSIQVFGGCSIRVLGWFEHLSQRPPLLHCKTQSSLRHWWELDWEMCREYHQRISLLPSPPLPFEDVLYGVFLTTNEPFLFHYSEIKREL